MANHNGMDINSYLVLPIQRIPRYVMLLEDMFKHTPINHVDHTDLEQVYRNKREESQEKKGGERERKREFPVFF